MTPMTQEDVAGIVQRAQARARAAHQAALRIPVRGTLSTTGPTDTVDRAVRKIADDMLDIAAVKGSVDEEDLLTRGWSLEAIRRHGPAARDLANGVRERAV